MYNPRHVTKGRIIQRKVPVDFDTEITDADFVLDPSLIDSQAGQYFVKDIGLFGEADPTEKVGSVIAQQTADAGTVSDEHPASANVPVPPSHQKEGRPKVLRKIMKGGMLPAHAALNRMLGIQQPPPPPPPRPPTPKVPDAVAESDLRQNRARVDVDGIYAPDGSETESELKRNLYRLRQDLSLLLNYATPPITPEERQTIAEYRRVEGLLRLALEPRLFRPIA